jgi:GxxExxY protein
LDPLPETTNAVSRVVGNSAFAVHSQLGAGLLESVYERCLVHELLQRGLHVRRQVSVPVIYGGARSDTALKLDLLVDECVIAEVNAIDALAPVHTAQLSTYLKLTQLQLGLPINFNVARIRDGIRRVVR